MRDPLPTAPRAGYTLPVFACAAAIAALRWLRQHSTPLPSVSVNLLEPPETVEIPIEQVARLSSTAALAITRNDPGDNLDLTRDTPVWAIADLLPSPSPLPPAITLLGGEGIGKLVKADNQPAIYAYARRLLEANLREWLEPGDQLQVTLILPEGRALAERTSNAAFGVVEGLSLLGTSGIAQPLSAPGQLEAFREEVRQATQQECLVFCVGENGLDLAQQMGIRRDRLLKTANWLGPLLVEAGLQGVQNILLFGYHGKLLKLAGGIFHTHHYIADGRQEILTAYGAAQGLPSADLQLILTSATAEAALHHLRTLDRTTGSHWVSQVYGAIAHQIDHRCQDYIRIHSERQVRVGSVLFDRDRQVIIQSEIGATQMALVC